MRPIIQKYNPVITPNANDAHSCFLRTMSTNQERAKRNKRASSSESDCDLLSGSHDGMLIKPSMTVSRRATYSTANTVLCQGECGTRSRNSCSPGIDAMSIPPVIHRPVVSLIRSHLSRGLGECDSSIVGHFDCQKHAHQGHPRRTSLRRATALAELVHRDGQHDDASDHDLLPEGRNSEQVAAI